jgi:hypothetical protein
MRKLILVTCIIFLTSFCIKTETNCGADYCFSSSTLLLDGLNSSAAYSLQKLRTAYSGPAIRVRRSSDNAEADIGFTASGDLDTVTLIAFLRNFNFKIPPTTFNGFVTIWYEQSGNGRNATQATAGEQPQIVDNGAVITMNGRPALRFDGNDILNTPSFILGNTVVTVARRSTRFQPVVEGANVGSLDRGLWGLGFNSIDYTTHLNYGINGGPLNATNADGFPMNVLQVVSQTVAKGLVATNASVWGIGGGSNGYVRLNGFVSEMVAFSSLLSTTDRQTIESNQMQYYRIETCGADYDFTLLSSGGMPGFQGNCFLVTNEQIRWLQLNGVIPDISTAPDNKECPTKSQFEEYIGGLFINRSSEYTALANNNCVPIGYWYP